jgi:hypothetical protein
MDHRQTLSRLFNLVGDVEFVDTRNASNCFLDAKGTCRDLFLRGVGGAVPLECSFQAGFPEGTRHLACPSFNLTIRRMGCLQLASFTLADQFEPILGCSLMGYLADYYHDLDTNTSTS